MIEHKLANYGVYTEGMRKSLLDKVYFMDKVDAKIFVDYGCADGALIKFLHSLFPEYTYIGYDISPEMVDRAKDSFDTLPENVMFSDNWDDVIEQVSTAEGVALILSSVIHEVYSYGTAKDTQEFLERVTGEAWDYIILRDMVPSMTIDRQSDINDVRQIMIGADQTLLNDFERRWGSIESNRNLVHFLMKYRYTDNWEREVRENYFPVTREEFFQLIPREYSIAFYEHFRLPYAVKTIRKDFGITLRDNTHLKVIFERNA